MRQWVLTKLTVIIISSVCVCIIKSARCILSVSAAANFLLQCMKVKSQSEVAQLCPTLHNPMDCSLPGSSIHGIFQARALELVTIAFSIPSANAVLIH